MASGFKCCTDKIKTKDDPDPASGNERIATDLYKSDFHAMGTKQRECLEEGRRG